jgi:hypothetical protein
MPQNQPSLCTEYHEQTGPAVRGLFRGDCSPGPVILAKLSPVGHIVTEHKFKIGRLVVFRLGWRSQVDAARGVYQIIRRLPPAEDGEFQYEIRSDLEGHTRVAGENELAPA